MPSAGSVSLSLTLDRSRFNQDIQSLQQLQPKPINLGLQIDPRSAKQQLEGVRSALLGNIQALGSDPMNLGALKEARKQAETVLGISRQIGREERDVFQEAQKSLQDFLKQRGNTIDLTLDTRKTAIIQEQLRNLISSEEAEARTLAVDTDAIRKRIALEQTGLAKTQSLKQAGLLTTEQGMQKESESVKRLGDLKLNLAEQELKVRQFINQLALSSVEISNELLETKIQNSIDARATQIKRLQLGGNISEEKAGSLLARNQVNETRQEIELTKKKISDVLQLQALGAKSQKDALRDRFKLQQQLGSLTLKQVDRELALQKALRQEVLKLAQDRIDAQKRLNDEISSSVELSKDLLDSRLKLDKALQSLGEVRTESLTQPLDRALEIRQRLFEGVKEAESYLLKRELASLGIGSNAKDVDILKQKIGLENQLSENKQAALLKEQDLQDRLLILDQSRNRLAAQKAILDAQSNLEKAKASGDSNQVKNAQSQLKIAQQRLGIEDQLSRTAIQALDVQQESERFKLGIDDRSRRSQQAAEAAKIPGLAGRDLVEIGDRIFGRFTLPASVDMSKFLMQQVQMGAVINLPRIEMLPPLPVISATAPTTNLENVFDRLERLVTQSGGVEQSVVINNYYQPEQRSKATIDNEKQVLNMLGRIVTKANQL